LILYNKKIKNSSPSREEAFNLALRIENSVYELHYQGFMEKKTDSQLEEIFIQLNNGDKDHAERILNYMEEHDISVQTDNNKQIS